MGNRVPATIALLLGLGLMAGSGYMVSQTRQFLAAAERAQGTVVDLERRSGKGGWNYAPVVEFVTIAGERRRFVSRVASDPPAHERGERVNVLYDPRPDGEARMESFSELWVASLGVGGIGLLCLGVGVGTFWYEYRRKG